MVDHGYGVFFVRIEEEDLDKLFVWRNSYDIYGWCRQFESISRQDHVNWFQKQQNDPSIRMYAISIFEVDKEGARPQIVGVAGFTSLDLINRRAEFSLYIGPEYHGRGLGKKGLKNLFAHGFDVLGLNVIWGETFDNNPAEKLFIEVGMAKEGTRREFYYRNGAFIDAHLYSITALEWAEREG